MAKNGKLCGELVFGFGRLGCLNFGLGDFQGCPQGRLGISRVCAQSVFPNRGSLDGWKGICFCASQLVVTLCGISVTCPVDSERADSPTRPVAPSPDDAALGDVTESGGVACPSQVV